MTVNGFLLCRLCLVGSALWGRGLKPGPPWSNNSSNQRVDQAILAGARMTWYCRHRPYTPVLAPGGGAFRGLCRSSLKPPILGSSQGHPRVILGSSLGFNPGMTQTRPYVDPTRVGGREVLSYTYQQPRRLAGNSPLGPRQQRRYAVSSITAYILNA